MKKEQIQYLNDQLLNEKNNIEKRLKHNKHYGTEEAMNNSIGELSGYDNHPADIGTELYEREKDIALNENDEQQLNEIHSALQRIIEGRYGFCEACHNEISYERLEAVPATRFCIDHQPSRITNARPVEEQVINTENYELNEGENAWEDVAQYGTSSSVQFENNDEMMDS